MKYKEKIKETILTEPVKILVKWLLSLLPLALGLIPKIRNLMKEIISYDLSLALIGISTTGLIISGIYTFHLYRRLKPKLIYRFKVYWDKKQNMYCPKDKLPLYADGSIPGPAPSLAIEVFKCLECERQLRLIDESGFQIELKDAKKRLTKTAN